MFFYAFSFLSFWVFFFFFLVAFLFCVLFYLQNRLFFSSSFFFLCHAPLLPSPSVSHFSLPSRPPPPPPSLCPSPMPSPPRPSSPSAPPPPPPFFLPGASKHNGQLGGGCRPSHQLRARRGASAGNNQAQRPGAGDHRQSARGGQHQYHPSHHHAREQTYTGDASAQRTRGDPGLRVWDALRVACSVMDREGRGERECLPGCAWLYIYTYSCLDKEIVCSGFLWVFCLFRFVFIGEGQWSGCGLNLCNSVSKLDKLSCVFIFSSSIHPTFFFLKGGLAFKVFFRISLNP